MLKKLGIFYNLSMSTEEIFEFAPSIYIDRQLTINELSVLSNVTISALRKRCQKHNIHPDKGYLSVNDCNLIINKKTDAKNWKIKNYLTLAEAASYIKKSSSCTKEKIKKFKIPYIKQELWLNNKPLGYIWISKSNVNKLKNCIEQNETNLKFGNYVTCNSIAKNFDIDRRIVHKIAVESKLPYISVNEKHFYTKENGARIEFLVQSFLKKKNNIDYSKDIENLNIRHPLVKDKRFFNESYFPESLPLQFQDMEDN